MTHPSAFEHFLKIIDGATNAKQAISIGAFKQAKQELHALRAYAATAVEHAQKESSQNHIDLCKKIVGLASAALRALERQDMFGVQNALDDIISLESAEEQEKILIYRGVNQPAIKGRKGKWWTTHPYYAYRYSGRKHMFVALVTRGELEALASDVSTEAEYQHYFFADQDPPNARAVTEAEFEALEARATFSKPEPVKPGDIPPPGGQMMKAPDNFIEVGRTIFLKTFKK